MDTSSFSARSSLSRPPRLWTMHRETLSVSYFRLPDDYQIKNNLTKFTSHNMSMVALNGTVTDLENKQKMITSTLTRRSTKPLMWIEQ